jgi:hypothetical protein
VRNMGTTAMAICTRQPMTAAQAMAAVASCRLPVARALPLLGNWPLATDNILPQAKIATPNKANAPASDCGSVPDTSTAGEAYSSTVATTAVLASLSSRKAKKNATSPATTASTLVAMSA